MERFLRGVLLSGRNRTRDERGPVALSVPSNFLQWPADVISGLAARGQPLRALFLEPLFPLIDCGPADAALLRGLRNPKSLCQK